MAALKERGVERPNIIAPATAQRDNPVRNSDRQILAVTRFNALTMPHGSAA